MQIFHLTASQHINSNIMNFKEGEVIYKKQADYSDAKPT
jgi:hypothetical protein